MLLAGFVSRVGMTLSPMTSGGKRTVSKKKKQKFSPEGKPRIPVGQVCIACTKRLDDCSGLPFDTFPINVVDETHVMVICKSFEHDDSKWVSEMIEIRMRSIP